MADVNVTYHLRRNDRVIVRGHIDATCDGFTHQLRACRQICGQKREREIERDLASCSSSREKRALHVISGRVRFPGERGSSRNASRFSLFSSLSRRTWPSSSRDSWWMKLRYETRTHTFARLLHSTPRAFILTFGAVVPFHVEAFACRAPREKEREVFSFNGE